MQDYKVFKVTPEILELFRSETVSAKSVKRLIPNYMEYQINKPERTPSKYLDTSADKLCEYLCKTHIVTAKEFLDGIESILVYEGLLRKDDTQEIFCFDGSTLDDGFGYYGISETKEQIYVESEASVLERICTEIRLAKKKEKEELKNIEITTSMLNKIANDPILMNKLFELKEFKNV